MRKIFYLFYILLVTSCGEKTESESSATLNNEARKEELYPDGIYCADINYFNQETGTSSNYTLNVEVENNKLTKIYWPNGGWLDESHFNPEELNENGSCQFTSDKGYEYEIKITGSKCVETTSIETDIYLTLIQCAQNFNMSEEELSKIESINGTNRYGKISEKRCNSFHDYIVKYRDLKEKMEIIENGSIQSVQIVNRYGRIYCQNIIVKRKGIYIWLEVNDSRKCPIGFLVFEPTLVDWQDVKVFESVNNQFEQIFSMRVMGSSFSKFELEEKIADNCQF